MIRILHNGLVIIAKVAFSNGFVGLDGLRVMGKYKVLGPHYCDGCHLRHAELLVTIVQGPFKLCNRLMCGPCSKTPTLVPKCRCGNESTRTVQVTVVNVNEELTYLDELCDSCQLSKASSLVNRRRFLPCRKGLEADPGEYVREYKKIVLKIA